MAEGWRRDFILDSATVCCLDGVGLQLGLLGALTFAPYLVLGLPAGALVDRWQRRGVLILSNLGQALPIDAIPLPAALDLLTFGRLLALACVAGTARVFFTIAYRSYLPAIVPQEHLTGANSRLTASESVAVADGPTVEVIVSSTDARPQTAKILAPLPFLSRSTRWPGNCPPRTTRRATTHDHAHEYADGHPHPHRHPADPARGRLPPGPALHRAVAPLRRLRHGHLAGLGHQATGPRLRVRAAGRPRRPDPFRRAARRARRALVRFEARRGTGSEQR